MKGRGKGKDTQSLIDKRHSGVERAIGKKEGGGEVTRTQNDIPRQGKSCAWVEALSNFAESSG